MPLMDTPRIKIVLLGMVWTGKSSLVKRYSQGIFDGPDHLTFGAAFASKPLNVDGKNVILDMWDTCGQERYESLIQLYYRGANAAIVCYDLTDRSSFNKASFWIERLIKTVENCQIYLCGTKCDLVEEQSYLREITPEESIELVKEIGGKAFETSSKTGKGIDMLFDTIVRDHLTLKTSESNKDTVDLLKHEKKKRSSTCCKQ